MAISKTHPLLRALRLTAIALIAANLSACDSGPGSAGDDDDFNGNPDEVSIRARVTPLDADAGAEYVGLYTLSHLGGASTGDVAPGDGSAWELSRDGIGIHLTVEVDRESQGVAVEILADGEVMRSTEVATGESASVLYYVD